MPGPEVVGLNDTAVLHESVSTDKFGRYKVGEAVEIPVEWCWIHKEAKMPTGEVITFEAQVRVDRNVPMGSVLWLGRLEDWYGTGGPTPRLMQVTAYEEVKDLKGREIYRGLLLTRFRGTLPTAET